MVNYETSMVSTQSKSRGEEKGALSCSPEVYNSIYNIEGNISPL